MGLAHWRSLVTSCFSFFSLSFFLSPSPSLSFSFWSLGAYGLPAFTYLPRFLRPEREDVLRLHSLGRLGGHLWPPWTGQTSCLGVLLAFYVNQGISASFSPLFSYLQLSFLLSLNQSLTPFLFQVSLDPAEAGPRCMNFYKVLGLKYTGRKD